MPEESVFNVTYMGRDRLTSGRMAALYGDHAPAAVRLAYFMVGDPHLAEDLVQDAFVRVFGRWGELRDPASFEAYLHRTVVNLARKYFRRRKVEGNYLERERRRPRSTSALDPDVETRDALWAKLDALPNRQRAALVLRFYMDMSEHDIARTLGTSPRATHSLVARGLKKLRDDMGREDLG